MFLFRLLSFFQSSFFSLESNNSDIFEFSYVAAETAKEASEIAGSGISGVPFFIFNDK